MKTRGKVRHFRNVYQKEFFPSKESDAKILQSIYFVYELGIISSYYIRIRMQLTGHASIKSWLCIISCLSPDKYLPLFENKL